MIKPFSEIKHALFGLYNIRHASPLKTTDYSKPQILKQPENGISEIPNEIMVYAGNIIHHIEKLCNPTQLAFLRVIYGYADKRVIDNSRLLESQQFTGNELNYLASRVCRDTRAGELCILAFRDPNSRDLDLYNSIAESSGILNESAKRKAMRVKPKLKELRQEFINTSDHDAILSHQIERYLGMNNLLEYITADNNSLKRV